MAASSLARAALWYARAGWPVLPLSPRSKEPLLRKREGGKGVKDATTDAAQLGEWWARSPGANVGLAGGPAWWALDVDAGAKGGLETMEALRRRYGPLPRTVAQVTGGGGFQLFFTPDARITNRVNANKLPGLDVRSAGGYVVAPPSVHPDTGRAYAWAKGRGPHEIGLATAPEWLIDQIAKKEEAAPDPSKARKPEVKLRSPDRAGRYLAAAIKAERDALFSAGKGGRNHTLYRVGCRLFEWVAGGWIPENDAMTILVSGARAIGLHAEEYTKTINSAKQTGLSRPRDIAA